MRPPRLLRSIYNATSSPRRTAQQLSIAADLARFRLKNGRALQRAKPRRTGAGSVLIISLSDQIYQLKLEGILAKSLQLEGYKPVVLTFRTNARWQVPYYNAFGVRDFVFTEDLAVGRGEAQAREFVDDVLAGDVGVQQLKALEFEGAKVGQQSLSSLSRELQMGRISLERPEVRAKLRDVLTRAVRAVLAGQELLERERPEIAIFNEKGYAGFGSIYDLALDRGANVIQFVAAGIHWRDALLFKRYTVDTRRVHPASLSPESWERVKAMQWDERHEAELDEEFALRYGDAEKHPDAGLQEGKRVKSPEEVLAQLGLDHAKKTAVLYSHVLWDANLFYGEDLFADQEAWLVETVRAACANDRVNMIVKLHPANMYKAASSTFNDEVAIREAVGELPPHVRLLRPETDINTFSLFGMTDYAITIRGTVGLEAPCFGARVLTAGTGRYSGLGFTDDSATAGEYLEKIARLGDLPRASDAEVLLAKKHAYGLFRLRPFRFSSYHASFYEAARLGHPLSHNLDVLLRTPQQVERAEDLRRFAAWAIDREQLDYLTDPT